MKKLYLAIIATVSLGTSAIGQTNATPSPSPTPQRTSTQQSGQQTQPPRQLTFDLTESGVQIRPEPRLILMMAALDAAGFDPTPANEEPSVFRAQVRRDQAGLDADLRKRMVTFYERNKLRDSSGKELPPAEQASRYVSMAYALGSLPGLEEPARSDDLPGGLLEVLDFAPLVREFYRKSGIDERMPGYVRSVQAEGDRLRPSVVYMVRTTLSYLSTKPITSTVERIPIRSPGTGKPRKDASQTFTTRQHDRHFYVVPDLLAAPGAINFRVIADDYFITIPYCDATKRICPGRDNNQVSPEVRRAYIQFVLDPLVVRFNREIAARKEQIKQLLDARTKAGVQVSPDVLLTVARSLGTAADVRIEETGRLDAITRDARARIDRTTDAAMRAQIVKELETARTAVADEAIARLAEAYESGAVLDFFFAEQLRGVESSGFDIANSLSDMISSFDVVRELRRLEESDVARKRALAARKARERRDDGAASIASMPNAALVRRLLEVDTLVQLKDYATAENRLLALLREFPAEPRIFFSLAETANLSARDATDEDVQSQRLNKALTNYRNAVSNASPDTDRCLVTRSHQAMGRILDFLERKEEAVKEFDAAIQINDTSCDAYAKAVEAKRKLTQPK